MMKLAGIHSVKEAINFLQGKVGDPYMKRYAEHLTSQEGRRNAPLQSYQTFMQLITQLENKQ